MEANIKDMKTLIVAHFDDECLWFNPQNFDQIYICNLFRRDDRTDMNAKRYQAWKNHPLKDKIRLIGLTETLLWKEPNEMEENAYQMNKKILTLALSEALKNSTAIYTHNAKGEYGHSDHLLINKVVMDNARCPVYSWDGDGIDKIMPTKDQELIEEETNLEIYKEIKALYQKHGCWTWQKDYLPAIKRRYIKIL